MAARALNLKFTGDSPPTASSSVNVVEETVQPTPPTRDDLPSSSSSPAADAAAADENAIHDDNDGSGAVDVDDDDDLPPKLPRQILKCLHCVFERYTNDLRYLANPLKSLKSEGFFRSNKVFITYRG